MEVYEGLVANEGGGGGMWGLVGGVICVILRGFRMRVVIERGN